MPLQATQLIHPVCICYMETPLLKPGLTLHRKCLSTSPICMLFSTSHISPGKFFIICSHNVSLIYIYLHCINTAFCVHHPRYWLWYTTQRCVSGVVRKVYQRLKQFKVQFLVLQRKTDPSQVMLQCLPANKVCNPPLCAVTV